MNGFYEEIFVEPDDATNKRDELRDERKVRNKKVILISHK